MATGIPFRDLLSDFGARDIATVEDVLTIAKGPAEPKIGEVTFH